MNQHHETTERLIDVCLKEFALDFTALDTGAQQIKIKSCYAKVGPELSLYVRYYAEGVGCMRYLSCLGRLAPEIITGRSLVISNIELAANLRGKGFLNTLLARIPDAIPNLSVIEFENVMNESLASYLERNGYLRKSEGATFSFSSSFYKVSRHQFLK